jgi:hypothetical protein
MGSQRKERKEEIRRKWKEYVGFRCPSAQDVLSPPCPITSVKMQAHISVTRLPRSSLLHSQIYGTASSLLLRSNEWRQFEIKRICCVYITRWNWCFLSASEYSIRLNTRCDKKLIETDLPSSIITWNRFLRSKVSSNSDLLLKLHKIKACLQAAPIPLPFCSICNSISLACTGRSKLFVS